MVLFFMLLYLLQLRPYLICPLSCPKLLNCHHSISTTQIGDSLEDGGHRKLRLSLPELRHHVRSLEFAAIIDLEMTKSFEFYSFDIWLDYGAHGHRWKIKGRCFAS